MQADNTSVVVDTTVVDIESKKSVEVTQPVETVETILQRYSEELNVDQKLAFNTIIDWFFQSSNPVYVFSGSGGTGKSFTVGRIILAINAIKHLQGEKKLNFAVAAPTVKALGVIQDYVNALELYPQAATIHSLLHVIPGKYDHKGNQILEDNKKSRQPHISEFSLTIIDESSMLDENLYRRVLVNVNDKHKVLFVGDVLQLPPVAKEDEDNTGNETVKLSPVFTEGHLICYLSKPVRYAGAIAEYANKLRENIDNPYQPRPTEGDNLTLLQPDEWQELFIEMLRKDPLNVRAICWTNQATISLANKARQSIYGDTADFHKGEVLTAKELVIIQVKEGLYLKDKIILHSCEECVLTELETVIKSFTFHGVTLNLSCYKLVITTEKADYTLYTPTRECLEKEVKPLLAAKKKDILTLPQNLRGSAWKEYYDILEGLQLSQKGNSIVYRLQYAGVLTIHQSQGSGYKHVFYNAMNVYGCQNTKMRNHLAYTGVTRAKEHLYICSKIADSRFTGVEGKREINLEKRTKKANIVQEKPTLLMNMFC